MEANNNTLPEKVKKGKTTTQLISEALKCVQNIEEELKKEIEEYNQAVTRFETLKDEVLSNAINDFQSIITQLENNDLVVVKDKEEFEKEETHQKKEFRLEDKKELAVPSFKKFSRIVKSLIIFLVSFGAIAGVGIVKSGLDIKEPQAILQNIEKIILTLGSFIEAPFGDALTFGYLLLIGVPLVLAALYWLITGLIMEKKNYKKALEIYNEAKEYESQRVAEIEDIKESIGKFESFYENLKTLKIFLEEMNSKLRRILHLEGKDVKNFHEKSKKDLQTSKEIEDAILEVIVVNIDTDRKKFDKVLDECNEFIQEYKRKLYA